MADTLPSPFTAPSKVQLGLEHVALIEGGAGVSVASRNDEMLPNLVRAVGGRLEPSGELTVFLSARDGTGVLEDLRANGEVAVVFSRPSTHRTLQLKGRRVVVEPAHGEDLELVRERGASMQEELTQMGFGADFARRLLAFAPGELVRIRFVPAEAFDQTPGPRAGAPLGTAQGVAPEAAPEAAPEVAPGAAPEASLAPSPAAAPPSTPGSSTHESEGTPGLDALRECLEGATPAVIATCSPEGIPNVSYLSQVQYVDREHVALSFQFFNKTRANVLANPRARLVVIHPSTGAMYRLTLQYLRTECAGPLFERMRATLASIASHTGMSEVFRLLGSDVYRVTAVEIAHGGGWPPVAGSNRLAALKASLARVLACHELNALLNETLAVLREHFGVTHSMLLLLDRAGERLYTVASLGYPSSGVGSEVPLGAGVVGVAVREGTPIRLSRLTSAYAYGRAIREAAEREGIVDAIETEIPFPGLAQPRSQLAVPIPLAGSTVGALLLESEEDLRFGYDDEDAAVCLAALVGQTMHRLQLRDEAEASETEAAPVPQLASEAGEPVPVRHYAADHSVFIGDDYLIKGVAGAVFWALVSDHVHGGRSSFTNRELRLDPRIPLPEVGDNLEARLVLLQRRLVERDACVRLEKTGRGRFALSVTRPLRLLQAG